ncbi:MAG TPA: hypothetical protein VGO50_07310 [Pyrinomonadaceae bacterium]|jgi:hypothetical protein|nr:hypothetical protein [Pyrinomonadaceae bacterium]
MNRLALIVVSLLALPAISFAQRTYVSVCADLQKNTDPRKEVALTICNQERGMSALPPLRLYLRLYSDGTAEYEENGRRDRAGTDMLVMHRARLAAEKIAEFIRLGSEPDFQNARADYPEYRRGDDSGLETTVIFGSKTILLRNYSAWDKDEAKHYPASLVLLMHLAEEFRSGKPLPGLKPKETEILEYARTLAVGKYYRAKANFSRDYGMTLATAPKLPLHHTVNYAWTNVNDFPQLTPGKDSAERQIVFRVLEKKVDSFIKNTWMTTFELEIVRVE